MATVSNKLNIKLVCTNLSAALIKSQKLFLKSGFNSVEIIVGVPELGGLLFSMRTK